MSIYTRTGDNGSTSLYGGKRVLKCEELVDVYGSIDELNSWVGLVASQIRYPDVVQFLNVIQSDLFVIASVLAGKKTELNGLNMRVKEMEARIDLMEKQLPKLNQFILPGGNELSGFVHVVRSICRRVERQTVKLATAENQKALKVENKNLRSIIMYLNRLSDLFFMLARFINKEAGGQETTWSSLPH